MTARVVETWELRRSEAQGELVAWIQARPPYCDRGRWHAVVEAPHWKSGADPWPRYYFDVEHAKDEVLAYCRAKKIDVEGLSWELVRYDVP